MITVLLAQLALVLLVEGLRFGPASDHLAPWPMSPNLWAMTVGVFGGLMVLRLRRFGVAEGRRGWHALAPWALWVLTPVAIWSVGDQVTERGPEPWILGAAILVAVVSGYLERRSWTSRILRGNSRANLASGGVLIAGGIAFAALRSFHGPPDPSSPPSEWGLALATYPLYAGVQLVVFLILPSAYLHREGRRWGVVVIVCTILFAFAHWPNPRLMALTAGGMLAWSWAWERGASLLPLAVAMGWLGAVFAQGLPPEAVGHMRVGPGYVQRMEQLDHLQDFDARVRFLASNEAFSRAGSQLSPWLEWVYREVFEEPMPPSLRDAWILHIEAAVRARMVRTFYESPEFASLHGTQAPLDGRDRRLLDPRFRPQGSAQAGYDQLRSEAVFNAMDRDVRAFLRHCYRQLLRREPTDAEVETWPKGPLPWEREEIVRMFLRAGPEKDFYIWKSEDAELWWPEVSSSSSK